MMKRWASRLNVEIINLLGFCDECWDDKSQTLHNIILYKYKFAVILFEGSKLTMNPRLCAARNTKLIYVGTALLWSWRWVVRAVMLSIKRWGWSVLQQGWDWLLKPESVKPVNQDTLLFSIDMTPFKNIMHSLSGREASSSRHSGPVCPGETFHLMCL